MKPDRLRELTLEELKHQRLELEEELFNLRVRRSLQPPDNPLQLRHLRRQLARIETVAREAQLGIKPLAGKAKKATEGPGRD
jgi:large subunit ribosomal protein L29